MRKCIPIFTAIAAMLLSCGGKDNGDPDKIEVTAPSGLVLHGAAETSLTFQWEAVSGASSYQWTLTRGGVSARSGSTKTRNVTVGGLEAGTSYRFGVAAVAIGTDGSEVMSSWTYVEASTAAAAEPDPDPDPDPEPGTSDGPDVTITGYADYKIPANEEDGLVRAFPGAEGGGMYTTGGRGGKVYHVTNLNDSGDGSLRWALGQKGARTIVFDVAGIIELQSRIQINNGDVTIAGQTAPGDGICLKNYTVNVNADNVIIRFVHFRLGDEGPNAGDSEDCIWGRYRSGIILDHCSMSWSIDECASFYGNQNMTMQWCILTESMNNSAHSKGAHGYGGIWGGKDASFHHNLLANHHSRNPRIDHPEIYPKNSDGSFDLSKRGNVDLRNLVIYNWGDNSAYGGEGGRYNFVNNYYKPGPDSKDRHWFVDVYNIYSSSKIDYGYPYLYMSGNVHTAYADITSDNSAGVYWHNGGADGSRILSSAHQISGPASEVVYTSTHSTSDAVEAVLAWAGDRLHRDAVDERAVSGVTSGGGKIINTPSDVGGWPSYSATAEQLSWCKDSDGDGMPDWFEDKTGLNKSDASDGVSVSLDTKGRYTNLEMYLHFLVRDIMAAEIEGTTYVKM